MSYDPFDTTYSAASGRPEELRPGTRQGPRELPGRDHPFGGAGQGTSIGASSTWQLDHNLEALEFPPLTDEELAFIDEHGIHGTELKL